LANPLAHRGGGEDEEEGEIEDERRCLL
jgi:hypothetical protein